MEDYMVILFLIGIAVYDNNDLVPENLPKQKEQQKENRKEVGPGDLIGRHFSCK